LQASFKAVPTAIAIVNTLHADAIIFSFIFFEFIINATIFAHLF